MCLPSPYSENLPPDFKITLEVYCMSYNMMNNATPARKISKVSNTPKKLLQNALQKMGSQVRCLYRFSSRSRSCISYSSYVYVERQLKVVKTDGGLLLPAHSRCSLSRQQLWNETVRSQNLYVFLYPVSCSVADIFIVV